MEIGKGVMGVPWGEAATAGSFIGQKLVTNEFVAFVEFADALKEGAFSPKVEAIDEHEPWEMIKQLVPSERQNSTIQQRDSQPWFPAEWQKAPWHLQALSAGQKLDNIRDS